MRIALAPGFFMYDHEILTDAQGLRIDPSANAVFIGPTKLDFSMLPTRMLVPLSEAKSLAQWRAEDLAQFYREQRSNRR